MKKAIIMMGLPLAGKTTWIINNVSPNYEIVSADAIKERHPDYDPFNAELLQDYSVKEAESMVYSYSDKGYDLVMDAGGINNNYTKRIISRLKQQDYFVELVHIKTPFNICLKRRNDRTRKVPESVILKKAITENLQFHTLKLLVDKVEVVEYYTNKHLFIDMDGVIAAMSTLPIINGEIDFVNAQVHRYLKPVPQMIDKLNELKKMGYNLYILSAIPNSFSLAEKNEWLDENFNIPQDHRYFVNQGKHKAEMLDNLTEHLKLKKQDVTMIDDMHETLYLVQRREMNCMHVSEFLAHEFPKLN